VNEKWISARASALFERLCDGPMAEGRAMNPKGIVAAIEAEMRAVARAAPQDRALEFAALCRFFAAYQACDQNRGVFSCVESHDGRCPKSRDPEGTRWKGGKKRPWRCECGREDLDAAEMEVERIRLLGDESKEVHRGS